MFALGDYRELLGAVMQDPATYLSMGSSQNRKSSPSHSLSRQLLEQYTLGPGLSSDREVQEVARAFTGWFVRKDRLQFVEREHDSGIKTLLGREGRWNSRDILEILLDHPASAQTVVRGLYRNLISDTEPAPDTLISELAKSFAKDFDIGRLVRRMLGSNLFFSKGAYLKRVKSPVEYTLGITLGLQARIPTLPLGQDLKKLGQELYNPPTNRGWPGGLAWITPATLIQRANIAGDLLSTGGRYGGKVDPIEVVEVTRGSRIEGMLHRLSDILLQNKLEGDVAKYLVRASNTPTAGSSVRLRRLVHGLATLPEFQLA
jgi:uncharacterized protein (DUF1800 family)